MKYVSEVIKYLSEIMKFVLNVMKCVSEIMKFVSKVMTSRFQVWFGLNRSLLTYLEWHIDANLNRCALCTYMNASCHMYEWVKSHIWMSHVAYMNELCHVWILAIEGLLPHTAAQCNTLQYTRISAILPATRHTGRTLTATHANFSHIACYRTHRRITRCLHTQARSRASRALMAHTPSQAGGHVWLTSFVNMHIHICIYIRTHLYIPHVHLWSIHHASNLWRGDEYDTTATAYSPLPRDSQYITNSTAFSFFVSWRDSESATNSAAYSPQDSLYITNPTAFFSKIVTKLWISHEPRSIFASIPSRLIIYNEPHSISFL